MRWTEHFVVGRDGAEEERTARVVAVAVAVRRRVVLQLEVFLVAVVVMRRCKGRVRG